MIGTFDNREAASLAAAETVARLLTRRLDAQPRASLVVPGGSTPLQCFRALSGMQLDWGNVNVVLSDERWVPTTDDASNERLVRETLLVDHASRATLLPVFEKDSTVADRAAAINEELRQLPFPFACSLLGMGEDGHFASLFPDAGNLTAGLDTDNLDLCLPVTTAASPHPRLSLTLSALSRSDEIVLLIFGEQKRSILETATSPESTLPVSRLMLQKRAPVNVFWAP